MSKDFYSENYVLRHIKNDGSKEWTGIVHFQITELMRYELFSNFIIGYKNAIELNDNSLSKIVEEILLKGFANNLPESLNILQRTFTSLLVLNPTKDSINNYINKIKEIRDIKIQEFSISNIELKNRLIENVIQTLTEILNNHVSSDNIIMKTCVKFDIFDKCFSQGTSQLTITNYNDEVNFVNSMLLPLGTISEFVEKEDVIIKAEEHKGIVSVNFNSLPLYIDKYLFITNDSVGILNDKGFSITYTSNVYDKSLLKLKFNFELNEENSFMKNVNKFKDFTNMIKNLKLQEKGEKTNLSQLDHISLKLKTIEISEDFSNSKINHKKNVAIILANNIVFKHSDDKSDKFNVMSTFSMNELYDYNLYKPYFNIIEETNKIIMSFNDTESDYGFNIEPLLTIN